MKSLYTLSFLFLAVGCFNESNHIREGKSYLADTSYSWKKLQDSSGWRKNYNFQLFTFRDTIWVFHSDGTWFSADGLKWQKSTLTNSIKNLAFLDYVLFKNAVLGLGHFEGNIEQNIFKPFIYSTTNFKNWDTISNQSNLPDRFFYHPFVYQDKIWIIGGEDKKTSYADIWNSADGVNWQKQKDNLPFGKRSSSQVVQLGEKLFLLNNDVWTSADGLNWELLSKEIVPGETIFGYSAIVYDQQIWLIGCNRNGLFSSEVLHSKDGKTWKAQKAPWLPRGGAATTVFNNSIYITGGKYGGTPNHPDFRYDNDIWVMEKK